ncbi:NrfD/PsrC family molybdoenzyme membrane anchor subunit [Gordonibacter massiliensis (ex Traore et al. 2017)]|uniref:NrfD/PsrC family molybdoenzyme membrane anchor subunit n=1 Tax=Gordonibacter massiliensis (ex Traore et al. 2017) TaxID=1841863 RepID=UPI0009AF4908|nr:NrfD/PsrC family molybdoenzyme membrane anchor subunit [Gordonibacter massiliensis (ex Traore et al. 2017)]MBX9032863.1 polysulfide reductase NrfD [Gordonibacter massiliensis (ex Traore et al. 2017)]
MARTQAKRRPFGVEPFSRRATVVWAVVVVALLAAGGFFMFDRLANGLSMAGATNAVPWGLWVAVYIWFSGLAGGLYLVSALVYLLRLPRFAPIARLALGGSIVSLVVSMIFIGIDLGAIRHSLGTLLFFHWSSPLAWEIKAYIFFMVVAIAQFALVLYNDRGARAAVAGAADGRKADTHRGNVNLVVRVLAGVGVATSFVGPPGGTGMFFAAVKTRGLWEGGITSVLFYVMAVVTAAAFLIVAYRLLCRLRGARPDEAACTGLARVLAASLFALALCVFFQLAPALLSDDPRIADAVAVMTGGYLAPLFWIGEIGLGLVVPAVLLALGAARRSPGMVTAASLSVMAGILALRYVLVVAGFSVPLLAGMAPPVYVPSLGEVMVALFVLGLGVALYGLAVRFLPLEAMGPGEGVMEKTAIAGNAAVFAGPVGNEKEAAR